MELCYIELILGASESSSLDSSSIQVSQMTERVIQNANSGSSDFIIDPSNIMKGISPSSLERSVSDTAIQKVEVKLNTESSIGEVDSSKGKDIKTNSNVAESITTEKPKGNINF